MNAENVIMNLWIVLPDGGMKKKCDICQSENNDDDKYNILENKYEKLCGKYETMVENLMSLQNK